LARAQCIYSMTSLSTCLKFYNLLIPSPHPHEAAGGRRGRDLRLYDVVSCLRVMLRATLIALISASSLARGQILRSPFFISRPERVNLGEEAIFGCLLAVDVIPSSTCK